VLHGRLLKEGANASEAQGSWETAGSHHGQTPGTPSLLAQSHFGFQERKTILGFGLQCLRSATMARAPSSAP
jgi:hypothetical protein